MCFFHIQTFQEYSYLQKHFEKILIMLITWAVKFHILFVSKI